MKKQICAILLKNESGDEYVLCIEGTPKSIIATVLKSLPTEDVSYTFLDKVVSLNKDKGFELDVFTEAEKTNLGSME